MGLICFVSKSVRLVFYTWYKISLRSWSEAVCGRKELNLFFKEIEETALAHTRTVVRFAVVS